MDLLYPCSVTRNGTSPKSAGREHQERQPWRRGKGGLGVVRGEEQEPIPSFLL